ncbi:hypothetical protein [Halobacterium zhouii]|uniref:hypothetical protein n=1 Tax=Halobacterium zhouii TaxID=2902624 RepID=UPI001E5B655B|nr:hypothetical protein [Halobacterium zhouii]
MVDVTYYCPRCGAIATLERDAYLADKSVTPFPLEGWTYVSPGDSYEADDVDGVRFVCGESDIEWSYPPDLGQEDAPESGETVDDSPGCGEPFYLNFVRYEDGREVEGDQESEYVELAEGSVPSGPRGPSGPGGPR